MKTKSGVSFLRLLPLGLAFALFGLVPAAHAQRDYFISPKGTQSVSASYLIGWGNVTFDGYNYIKGASIDQNIAIAQYSRAVALGNHRAGLVVVQPAGKVTGSFLSTSGPLRQSGSGLGDIQFGGTYALAGPPPMTPAEYVQWKPGFAATFAMMVSAPTGDYDSAQAINLGGNRWTFAPAVAFVRYIGDSLIDPHLMTLELKPGLTFFTDNNDLNGGGSAEQKVLYSIEGHITKGFGGGFWGSFGGYYTGGGAVTKNGGKPGDAQNAFRLGVALNYSFSSKVAGKAIYVSNAWTTNPRELKERSVRVILQCSF
jgi:hypothetical protein